MTVAAIRTEGLTRDFGSVRAVAGISLEVPIGSIFSFLGPNGAGKTTTIRLLLGLIEPTAGEAEVLGFDIRTQAVEIRERTGALLEHSGLYERLSAEDNLEFYGRIWRMPRPERAARIRELLTHLGLWERRREQVGTWSRGMKQKLAVARALLHRPALIFLDEPTAGLDPVATIAFREDIVALAKREGTTVILTTHNLAEAEKISTLVGMIRGGRLVEVGPPDQLRSRARMPRTEIHGRGLDERLVRLLSQRSDVAEVEMRAEGTLLLLRIRDNAPIGPLISAILEAGGEVDEIRRNEASLEDAYLHLMEGRV